MSKETVSLRSSECHIYLRSTTALFNCKSTTYVSFMIPYGVNSVYYYKIVYNTFKTLTVIEACRFVNLFCIKYGVH